jgi:VanZ family protein
MGRESRRLNRSLEGGPDDAPQGRLASLLRSRWFNAWAPALSYMLLIWALSSIPTQFDFSRIPFRDKGVHFVEYGTLSVLLSHAARGTWRGLRPLSVFLLAVTFTTLWGIIDEIHQAFVPGRVSDVNDVLADALGALIGGSVYWLFRRQLGGFTRP